MNTSEPKLGISLSSLNVAPRKTEKQQQSESDISAYAHDITRSLVVGGLAIAIELALYFSGALSRFM